MATYIFGISQFNIGLDLKDKMNKALHKKKLSDLINHLSNEPGAFVLPNLKGSKENLGLVRKRHFGLISKVFSKKELKKSIKSELEAAVLESPGDASELVVIEGSSIECTDWLPAWLCEWWGSFWNGGGDTGGDSEGQNDDWPTPDTGDDPDPLGLPPWCFILYPDGSYEEYWHDEGPNVS